MVLSNLDLEKREEVLRFFEEKFRIKLEKYEEDTVDFIVNLVNSKINHRLDKEMKKNIMLSSELERQKKLILELVNGSGY